MNSKFKKWTQALLAGLCLCFTVTAFSAERIPVKVAEFEYHAQDEVSSFNDMDALCKWAVDLYQTKYFGLTVFSYGYYNGSFNALWGYNYKDKEAFVSCHYHLIGTGWQGDFDIPGTSTFANGICKEGGINLDQLDGCYEWVDCDDPYSYPNGVEPEVCKPDPCDPGLYRSARDIPPECKPDRCDPNSYNDRIIPADCCVPTGGVLNQSMPEVCKTQCPKEPPKDSDGETTFGSVTCGDVPCVWTPPGVNNDKAKEIVEYCALGHEKLHLENQDCYPAFCMENGFNGSLHPYDWMSEVISYQASAKCLGLNLNRCKGDTDCEREITEQITNDRTQEEKNRKKVCKHFFGVENCTDDDIGDEYKCPINGGDPKREID